MSAFCQCFKQLTGYDPLPWQRRLYQDHFEKNALPDAVSIPTGLGKTAVMALWLIALAEQCRKNEKSRLPLRLVYVVDRRAVVDQSTSFAEKLRENLAKPEAAELREALGLSADQKLPISTLRGQFVDNREWLEDPSRPAIIIGTVDMIGSRLLFEGYGVSRRMRPYHAGLLGADALVLLDEAHLVPPFKDLLSSIARERDTYGPRASEASSMVPAFKILPLSATSRTAGQNVFALQEDDYKDASDEGARLTRQRLGLNDDLTLRTDMKQLRVIKLGDANKSEDSEQAEGNEAPKETKKSKSGTDLLKGLAEEAWRLAGDGSQSVRILVYCDHREDAQKVHDALFKRIEDKLKPQVTKAKSEKAKEHSARVAELARGRIELFVGARRVQEREDARKRLEEMGFLAGSQAPTDGPRFLVATSAGEVGVDLDADHMVCDLVPWDRMVQRFGRVNRRGTGQAVITVVVPPLPPEPNKPKPPAPFTLTEPASPGKKPRKPGKNATPQAPAAYQKDLERYETKRKEYEKVYKKFKEDQKKHDDEVQEYEKAVAEYHEECEKRRPFEQRIALLEKLNGNASPDALLQLSSSYDAVIREASTPAPLRPALTRPLVDAWSMTSLKEHTGRPRIEPWLRGWVKDEPQTSVVWRTYLPVRSGNPATKREIEDFFDAAPPDTREILETETWRVWDWLTERVKKLVPEDQARKALAQETWEAEASEEPDAEAEPEDIESAEKATEESPGIEEEEHANNAADATADDAQNHTATAQQAAASAETFEADEVVAIVLSPSGDYVRSLRARDILFASQTTNDKARKKKVSRAKERITDALSGTTLIVSARLGGLRNGLLDDACEETAKTADGPESWGQDEKGNPFIRFRVRVLENGAVETASQPQDKWREASRFDLERNADGEPTKQLLIEEWPDVENTEDRRSNGPPQTLAEHQSWTECAARKIAQRLGLDTSYSNALAIAARLHDEGKRADRWQRAFRAPRNGGPYAKVNRGINQALLDGYRHEFGSLPYAAKDSDFQKLREDLKDLVLHLIAAHHGQARPVIETRGCDAPPSVLEDRAREVALRFAHLQRRWGPWGLAWWEALLRAADQQASRANDQRASSNGKGGN